MQQSSKEMASLEKDGSTPREWHFSFLTGKEEARKARDVIVKDWKPERPSSLMENVIQTA